MSRVPISFNTSVWKIADREQKNTLDKLRKHFKKLVVETEQRFRKEVLGTGTLNLYFIVYLIDATYQV